MSPGTSASRNRETYSLFIVPSEYYGSFDEKTTGNRVSRVEVQMVEELLWDAASFARRRARLLTHFAKPSSSGSLLPDKVMDRKSSSEDSFRKRDTLRFRDFEDGGTAATPAAA